MVFRVDTMLAEMERLIPDRLEAMRRLARRPDERRAAYAAMPPWSFDREVFARLVQSMIVLPVADVGWSGWRTPQAIVRSLAGRAEKPLWWASAAALVA
jgi:mannose-1-phosphate guanylyltransferase